MVNRLTSSRIAAACLAVAACHGWSADAQAEPAFTNPPSGEPAEYDE